MVKADGIKLGATLRKWNAQRRHDKAIATVRAQLNEICGKTAETPRARSSCMDLLPV